MRSARLQRLSGLFSTLFVTLSALILVVSSTTFAQAQNVWEAWVARYNGPDNAMDTGNAVAVDEQGNVYVAGGTGNLGPGSGTNDYAILKYDPNGNLLWAQRYNGPGSGPYLNDDTASALAVDKQGNVYVTGWSRGNDTTYDYATLKYDPNGTLLWVQRYSNPDSYDDAKALAVDGQGNVYVTGSTATLKYDTNGTLLWARRYNDGNGYSSAIALAMDEQGNVYVTGSGPSVGTAGFGNYITLKYDTNGTLLWAQRYNGPGINGASASDIAVDQQGNTYVTGVICTANDAEGWCINTDYATLKYDPQGNLQWEQRYNGPGNSSDYPYALAVDAQGSIYVTGYSWGGGSGSDYAALKYDTNGKRLWAQRYNGPGNNTWDEAHALTVDQQGNVYVTGVSTGNGTYNDYATLKYGSNGNLLWELRYNSPSNGSDTANALTVDKQGNVYVTGVSWGSGNSIDVVDAVTIKYSQ